jgi:aminoglycoside phosphotransferase (APT) family kinase protein
VTSAGSLPPDLYAWIQSATSGTITDARRQVAGASRQAWSVDVERGGTTVALFVLRDALSGRGGSVHDGAVLAALAGGPVPVPKLYAVDERLGAVLLERVEGRSDFHADVSADQQLAVGQQLMQVAAALHRLEPSSLPLPHLGEPGDPARHGAAQLAKADDVAQLVGVGIAPLFSFALAWLRRHVPTDALRTSLVHSDLGPGNFLYVGDRITALLDWEVAHWGDAMEDLAAVSVRDMATPVGHLPTLYREYEAASGEGVDLARVRWYRVLVLTRNSMLIGLGLGQGDAGLDRAQLTMFRTLLMRGAALALCDAIGIERPFEAPLAELGSESDDLRLIDHGWHDQRHVVIPAVGDGYAVQRAEGVSAILGCVDHRVRFGQDYLHRELDALAGLIGRRPPDESAGYAEVGKLLDDSERERALAVFFAGHLLRRGMLYAPLLGPLVERYPQPLEDG